MTWTKCMNVWFVTGKIQFFSCFQCACLSGAEDLIKYMIRIGELISALDHASTTKCTARKQTNKQKNLLFLLPLSLWCVHCVPETAKKIICFVHEYFDKLVTNFESRWIFYCVHEWMFVFKVFKKIIFSCQWHCCDNFIILVMHCTFNCRK